MHKELDSWEESWPTQILAETLCGSVSPGQVVSSWFPCF